MFLRDSFQCKKVYCALGEKALNLQLLFHLQVLLTYRCRAAMIFLTQNMDIFIEEGERNDDYYHRQKFGDSYQCL